MLLSDRKTALRTSSFLLPSPSSHFHISLSKWDTHSTHSLSVSLQVEGDWCGLLGFNGLPFPHLTMSLKHEEYSHQTIHIFLWIFEHYFFFFFSNKTFQSFRDKVGTCFLFGKFALLWWFLFTLI